MKRLVRDVKKEAEELISNGEIEDFRFDHDRKHPLISFLSKGEWHTIPFASSPRSTYVNNFVRQQIRRKLRGIESGKSGKTQPDRGRPDQGHGASR